MRRAMLLLIIFMSMVGCALPGGPIKGKYPPTSSSQTPATIIIESIGTLIGEKNNREVTVNGEPVYIIGQNQQIVFNVDPGQNLFGVKSKGSWTSKTNHYEIRIACEPGKTYYLLIQVGANVTTTIERVSNLQIKNF